MICYRSLVLVLIVAASALTCALAKEDPCETRLRYFTPRCYGACPFRSPAYPHVSAHLTEALFGQEDAIRSIVMAFQSYESRAQDRPLVFHFAGDNGVGKTLATFLIGEGMFYYTESTSSIPRGMLYIRGNDYRLSKKAQESDPTKLSALSEQFHNEIAFFLHRCPNALVVIDEAELINRSIMVALEQFLDGAPVRYGGSHVSTRNAVFIVVSDFGVEGFSSGMTRDELQEHVISDTRRVWRSSKHEVLLEYVIPFIPMPLPPELAASTAPRSDPVVKRALEGLAAPHSVERMVEALLESSLSSFALDHPVKVRLEALKETVRSNRQTTLADHLYRAAVASPVYRFRNYRAISQLYQAQFMPELITAVEMAASQESSVAGTGKLWANVQFSIDDGGVISFVVEMSGRNYEHIQEL